MQRTLMGRSSSQVYNLFSRLRLDRTQPGVVDASPGQRIRLTCHAEDFPAPTIEWQRDGQLVSSPRFIQLLPCPTVLSPATHPMEARAGLQALEKRGFGAQSL